VEQQLASARQANIACDVRWHVTKIRRRVPEMDDRVTSSPLLDYAGDSLDALILRDIYRGVVIALALE
jgi:hypothetical protein